MNQVFTKLHKTRTVSTHVLNLRDVKTPRELQLAAAKEALRNKTSQVLSIPIATQPPLVTVGQSETSTSEKHAPYATFSLSPVKLFSLFLIIVINLSALSAVGPTNSYYVDSEGSDVNTMATGLVDFTLETIPFIDTASSTTVSGQETWEVDVMPNELSNPFYYYASSTNFSGSLELCEVISVTATLDGEVMFDGLLSELTTASTTLIDTWTFAFSGAVGFPGEICYFDIDFNGWQVRHDIVEGGYSDTETVSYWILDPSLVINKVYFADASTTPRSTESWVELYNPTGSPIDISGGFLCDDTSCDTLPIVPPIPSLGYALIAGSEDILTQVDVPDEVILILIPDGVIGDALARTDDMLELQLSLGQPIDRLNWGEINTLWPNYSPELWSPSLPIPQAGGAFTRIPIGIDTNTPEDFVELKLPEVDISQPSAGSVWAAGSEETITWTAVNPNGDDEDVSIDIYYIDASSTVNVIALDTPNDGAYDWIVPEEEQSTVVIKLVATGPENILLNSIVKSEVITIVCGANSTSSQCVGLNLIIEKKFSGPAEGFTVEQFSFRVEGGGINRVVPHKGSILLPVGAYTITELVPEGFDIPDWRLQWSGDTCTGENVAGGLGYIDVEERDLRKITSYCLIDNQFRPESHPESDDDDDEIEPSASQEHSDASDDYESSLSDDENATSTQPAIDSENASSTEDIKNIEDTENIEDTQEKETDKEIVVSTNIATSTDTEFVLESIQLVATSTNSETDEEDTSQPVTENIQQQTPEPVIEIQEETLPEEESEEKPIVPEITTEEVFIEESILVLDDTG